MDNIVYTDIDVGPFVAKVNWTLLQCVFEHYCKSWEEVRYAFYSSQKPSFTGVFGGAPKSILQLWPLSHSILQLCPKSTCKKHRSITGEKATKISFGNYAGVLLVTE